MPESADVIVVGGGVIGAAISYYLSREGARVLLVERDGVASGTSSHCDGNVLAIDKMPGFDSQFTLKSQELLEGLQDELSTDFEYRRLGSTLAVENEQQEERAREWVAQLATSGLPMRYIERDDVHADEPLLAEDIVGLVECASDSSLDPMRLVNALVAGAQDHGARVQRYTEVRSILREPTGEIRGVWTAAGPLCASTVVLAAGVWTPALAATVDVSVPIRPRKGHILVCRGGPRFGRRKVMEFGYLMAKFQGAAGRDAEPDMNRYGVAMVFEPTPHGSFLFGSSRQFVGLDTTCDNRVLELMARRAARFFPALADARIIRTYAGLRPYTPDHLPIISPVDTAPGLFVAAGHEGDGIGLAPITGKVISELITGQPLTFSIDPLSLNRFANHDHV